MTVAGGTSTGSKRGPALFGTASEPGLPTAMAWSRGVRIGDTAGREYLDFVMALGAVSLGYGHPEVNAAAAQALDRGMVGPLPPVEEALLAAELAAAMPWLESVRFLKTGAEAVAAAVRLARTHTGRDRVVGCGYHGWLDGVSHEAGVPAAVRRLYQTVPFNDVEAARRTIREVGDELALVIVEPVVDGPPAVEWLRVLRDETERVGAALVFDEIKTGFRVAVGGAVERWGVRPDLAVYGKGLANGFPLAVVGGGGAIMAGVDRTWISSTLATESVALAAARATLAVIRRDRFPDHAGRLGGRLMAGLQTLAGEYPDLVAAASGIAEMCYLRYRSDEIGGRVAAAAARRGLLFKRSAYNFVALAHQDADVDQALGVLGESLREVGR
ncbi:MAG: aminotransferase class III-fold pyridoxal phosphate-dependent enzyme [Gemmatimonadales bacterium]